MTTYLTSGKYQGETEVPDPFHGGPEHFEKVIPFMFDTLSLHAVLHLARVGTRRPQSAPDTE